ncbi:MAG TPA: hypothetical protein VNN80_10910 [Polyangiaceae bacterium]|nr:hypothetical protein [Polyangiaceae bacterium]HWP06541.1 hypothetical protein [Polyangiaceae bacterium]
MSDRKSPSGPISSIKGTIAIASTAVATTAVATATGSFVPSSGPDVPVNSVLSLSPQANLTASISVGYARVVSAGIVVVSFVNVGASTAQAAVTFDADAQIR